MAKIVPFKGGKSRAKRPPAGPTREEVAIRIQTPAVKGEIDFSPHALERMGSNDRDVTAREVTECRRKGEAQEEPSLDEFGEWGLVMARTVAGRRIKVKAAVGSVRVTVVTVYPPN